MCFYDTTCKESCVSKLFQVLRTSSTDLETIYHAIPLHFQNLLKGVCVSKIEFATCDIIGK